MSFVLTFLGGFQALVDGQPVKFATNFARALLAYLAVEAHPCDRTTLVGLLWPDQPDASARQSLRQTLFYLRQALAEAGLGEQTLIATPQTLHFQGADVDLDVRRFQQLVASCAAHVHDDLLACPACIAQLHQAADLYGGEFLQGLVVKGSQSFEEWVLFLREQLHRRAVEVYYTLAQHYQRAGGYEQMQRYAARQLALEPWREEAHRQMMWALAVGGQRSAALAQYNTCRQVLGRELGVAPDAETVALYEQIRAGPLAQSAPRSTPAAPPRPSPPLQHNPPVVRTSLIGRDRELAELTTHLQQPDVRLLTLVGPGGMGKTRLALAVAARVAPQFTAGVCIVGLAELTDSALLPQVVAGALGQTDQAAPTGQDRVASYLRDKHLLLVLDSCEHLGEAVTHWSQRWLNACPALTILATSHGALNVADEHVWLTPTLTYPPASGELSPDELLTFEAAKLFVARAQEVSADFALTAANSSAVAEICRQLEGIPLALELAAARVRLLTPAEIAVRLRQCIEAAVASNRSAPVRHQTMRAALEWSFDSLAGDEQTLLQRLALFAGGCTLSAVEAIADLPDTLNVLSRLFDRALVTREALGDQTRYRMLALIREYALDKLRHSGEAQRMHQRHAEYFLGLAEGAQLDLQADGEALWLQPEVDNLNSALEWALASGHNSLAVRLAGALTWYWWMRGYLHALRPPLQQALAQVNQADGEIDATPPPAMPVPPAGGRAMLPLAAGALLALWDEPANAQSAFTRALALAEEEQNWHTAGLALRRLTGVAVQQKAYAAANEFIGRGLAVWQRLGAIWHIAWLYAHQGDIAFELGDQPQAWLAYEASTKLPVHPGARAYPFRRMAYLALARGDHSQALALCRESLQLNLASGDRQGIAACLVGVASIQVAHIQTLPEAARPPLMRRAVQLLGAVESILQTVEGRLLAVDEAVHQQTTTRLRQQPDTVSPEAYVAALAEGRAMALEQAIDIALQAEEIALPEEPAGSPVPDFPSHPVNSAPLHDWVEMPAVDFFTGREAEVAQLTAWLAPQAHAGSLPAQFVLILGIGGIGKTTLAAAVTKAVASAFPVVIWRSLLNAPPLSELLRSWLQILSRQTLTSPPASLDEQLRLLATYLRQERCLLVLDNVESIFAAGAPTPGETPHPQGRAGVMRPGYEGYDQLFQWLANSDHQSCLLLTSREQPYSLVRLGRQAQEPAPPGRGRIRMLPLSGLDRQAGRALLQSNGLHPSAEEAAQLIETYSGNPLALQIVAGAIADFFGGDVAAFQQAAGALFDGMRLVLDQQFARLSPLEREILVWLAIEREAASVQTVGANLLQPVSMGALLEALQALKNRSLLEKRDAGLTLQNVIIEYTTGVLVEQVCQEIVDFRSWILDLDAPAQAAKIQNSFLNRFALLKAEAKEYVRQSQVRLIVQPVAAQLAAQLGKAQVAACISGLLDVLRAAGVRTGYAGGNLLNLLVALGEDLAGYDFSHLAVWQADLRRVKFAAINFAGADLTHSSFILAFDLRAIKFAPSHQPPSAAARQVLIAGTVEGDVCVWQAADGQLSHAFRRPSNSIYPVVFSPDGRQIATSGRDFAVHVWSAESGQPLCTLAGHTDKIYMLAFSADGQYLASSSNDSTLRIWHLPSRRLLHTLVDGVDAFMTPTFSTGGAVLAAGGGQPIYLWDVASGRLIHTLRGHVREIECLAFSPDDRLLVSGSHDGSIRVWDARSGEHLRTLQVHNQIVRALAFAPGRGDGYLLASGSADRSVRLWDLGSGQVLQTLLGHKYEVGSLSFSPDGQALASGSIDRTVHIWEPQTGRLLDVISGHATTVRAVAFNPAGDRLASGGADGIVRLWAVRTAKAAPEPERVVHQLPGHAEQVYAVNFSPDGRFLASAGSDRLIYLWDVATGKCVQILRGHQGLIKAVAFSPDSGLFASAGADCTIRIWSAATGQNLRILEGHEAEVTTLAFHPAGGSLLSGSADHTARIWDIDRGEVRFVLKKHTSALYRVVFHPAGQILATNSWDSTLHLWEASTGAHRPDWASQAVRMFDIAFHPAGSLFAGVTPAQAIELRAYPSGEVLHTLRGHTTPVLSLAFHPTQPLLASSSWNGAIRLWDTQTGDLRNTLFAPGPYAGMEIAGVTGISEAQRAALKALGAVEYGQG